MDSKTRTPLIIVFGVVLIFILGLTATGAYLLLSGIQKVEEVVADNTHKGNLITDMRVAARLRSLSLSQMLLIEDPFARDEEYNRFNAFGTDFIVARNKLKETTLTENESAIFQKEVVLAGRIGAIQQQIVDYIQEEDFEKARSLQVNESIPLQRETDAILKQLQNLQRESIRASVVASVEEFRGSLYALLGMALFIIIAIGMIARAVVSRAVNAEHAVKLRQIELESRVQERTSALVLAKEQAELASQIKTDFLSRMSHELRTPLNAILGFSQILQFNREKTLTDEQLENASEIQTAGTHLLDLISELLDMAQIESGNLELDIEEVSLPEIINETVKMLEPLAEERSINIINSAGARKVLVLGDKLRLKQVSLNILANAIKYNNEHGSVYINIESSKPGFIKLNIRDTGCGISEQDKKRIFDNFERLGTHADVEGSGIGLSVARHLIDLMGGKIGVESIVNNGCTFWIELPVKE